MFKDKGVIFGGGISSARIHIFTKFWQTNGGIVLSRKKPPGRTTLTPLSTENIHFIIIENKKIRLNDLEKQLHCSLIPEQIVIVHCSWIEKCARYKEYFDFEPFIIQPSEAVAPEVEASLALSKKRSLGIKSVN
jgi:hypothetical protein